MSLLKTQEYIDLVELSNLAHAEYGWPELGQGNSFHRAFSDAMDRPSNGEMIWVEMVDPTDAEEDYGPDYAKVMRLFVQLIDDGHLPDRDEYNVSVWW
jgi:hypothetical protein